MLWFLRDYPLAAMLLRAATLAFDSLLIGGIVFCTLVLPPSASSSTAFDKFSRRAVRLLRVGATGLAAAQAIFVSLDTAMLISTTGLGVSQLYTSNYFLAGLLLVITALIFLLMSRLGMPRKAVWLLFVVPLMLAIVWTSH
ncbi:MAG: hypothetical protein V4587_03305, partial [Acidobacteriota bacterium]